MNSRTRVTNRMAQCAIYSVIYFFRDTWASKIACFAAGILILPLDHVWQSANAALGLNSYGYFSSN